MSTQSQHDQVSWFASVFRAIGRVVRPPTSAMQGGGAKLPPISDILSRTGREPSAPD
jgi:hypothetical protein